MKTDATFKSNVLMNVVNQAMCCSDFLLKGIFFAMFLLFSSNFVLAQTGSNDDPLIIVKKGFYPGDGIVPEEVQEILSLYSTQQLIGTQGDTEPTGTPPTIENCPADQTVECFGDVGHVASELDYTINCGPNGIIIIYEPPGILETGSCPGTEYVVTYDVWDQCGNNVTCDQIFTIDNPGPEITFCPEGGEIASADEAVSDVDAVQFSFSCPDDPLCSDITVSVELEEMLDPCLGDMFIYTYTIMDACGRSDECEQIFTIPPPDLEISCPSDSETVDCASDINPTEADVELGGLIDGVDYSVSFGAPTLVSGDENCPGAVYEVIVTVTDDCDREATCTLSYTIENEGPTIIAPADVDIECAADAAADVDGASFSTSCELGGIVTAEGPILLEGDGECVGSIWKFEYTVTDECGRTASADQLVTIANDGPEITIPEDADLECGDSTDPMDTGMATASDPCEGELDVSFEDEVVSEACPQIIERTWSASNECGVVVSGVQTITLIDEEAPVFDLGCQFDFDILTSDGADCPSDAGFSFEEGDEFPVTEGYTIAGVDIASLNGCVTDNCTADEDIIIRVATIIEEGDGCSTTFTVDFEALDECGNVGGGFSCNYTVIDDVAPELQMPEVLEADITCGDISLADAEAFANGTLTEDETEAFLDAARALFMSNGLIPLGTEDDCNESDWVEISINVELSGDCDALATLTCEFVAEDVCGNVSESVSSSLNIVDETAPVITCPADATVSCDEDFSPESTGEATATDDCGQEVTLDFTDGVITGSCPQVFTRTWSATDACGNSSTCEQVITIVDEEAPVFDLGCQFDFDILTSDGADCPSDAGFSFEEGDEFPVTEGYTIAGVDIASLNGCVTDNCTADEDIIIRVATITEQGDGCSTTFTVDFEALDECGNVGGGFSCNYTVIDDVAPELQMPEVLEADITCGDISLADAEAFANGTLTEDETEAFLDAARALFMSNGLIPLGTEDDCNESDWVEISINVELSGDCDALATLTCEFVAEDVCGNVSESVSSSLNIVDETAPVITCPADATVSCDEDFSPESTGEATATDDCGQEVTLDFTDGVITGSCPQVFTRTWSATDACGNSSTCEQVITIVDEEAPVFDLGCQFDFDILTSDGADCPSDAGFSFEEGDEFPVTEGYTIAGVDILSLNGCVTDNCTANEDIIIRVATITEQGDGCSTTFTVDFEALDECGNVGGGFSCNYTVIDDQAPELNMPEVTEAEVGCSDLSLEDATAFANGTLSPEEEAEFIAAASALFVEFGLIPEGAQDDCNEAQVVEVSIEATVPEDACPLLVELTCTFVAIDDCANVSEAQSTSISIIDNTPPVITCPDNVSVACDQGISPDLTGMATATDDCGAAEVSFNDVVVSEGCPMIIERTFTATDECGLTALCTQEITVTYEDPTIMAPDAAVFECAADAVANVDGAMFTTACDLNGVVTAEGPFLLEGNGVCDGSVWEIVYTVTDDCGRTASDSQTVTIENDGPTVVAPEDAESQCIDFYVPNPEDAVVTTSCDLGFDLEVSDPVLIEGQASCNLSVYEITYTVTDECGRTASDIQILTSVNGGLAVLEEPEDLTVTCYEDIVPDPWAIEFFSPCSSDVFIQVTPPTQLCCEEDCPGAEYSIIYTITNDCGDEVVVEQMFVIDNEGPTIISCGDDEMVESVDDIMVSIDDVEYETACGVECDVTVVSEPEIVDNGCGGVDYVYTYTVTDNCGRTATCDRTFTIPSDDPTCNLDDDCNSFTTFYADINGNQTTLYSVVFTPSEALLTYETEVDFSAHIAFDAINSVVYLVDDNGSSLLAYDPSTDTELFELTIGGNINQLFAVVYNPMDELIYVGDANDDEIYTIDPLGFGDVNFFANAPVEGGDLAIQDGTLYLVNRGNSNLYTVVADDDGVSDGISDATLVGATDSPEISGMAPANNTTSFILSNANTSNFTKVNATDASTENVYMAMLDGEIFELASGGDMAAGCANNFGSEPCSYTLYYTHNPEGTSNYSLLEVELDALGNATFTTLLEGLGSSHIGLSNDGSEIYMVGGSNVLTYDVALGSITNNVSVFNGANNANLSSFPAAVVGPDNQLFIAGAGNNVWLCDPESGEATNIASGINVNGGDLIFAPTGEEGAEELWIITRNNATFTRVLDPGNGSFSVDVSEINGAAVLENGNVLLADGDGNSLLKEVNLTSKEIVATYDIDLPLFNGDLAGGCTGETEVVAANLMDVHSAAFPSNVYPNPSVDNAVITFEPVENARTQVELFDMSGRPMQSLFNAEVKSGLEYRVNVNTSVFEDGIYLYRITNGSHQVTKKLMIVD